MEVGGEDERGKRTIKLFCPSASKSVRISASDQQKLNLGSIARAFGIDPKTLKLNGHFVSRGVDLVASSVTWRSLIGFFSARGLSTGATHSDALLVHGIFSKLGSKRSHCLEDRCKDGAFKAKEQGCFRENKRARHEICSVLHKEKLKGSDSGQIDSRNRTTGIQNELNGLSLKRNWLLIDEIELKRTKYVSGVEERKDSILTNGRVSCSFISRNTKRTRDGEMVNSSPS